MTKLIEHSRKHWGGEKFEDNVIEKELTGKCLVLETRFKQFITYLNHLFPSASLSLSIHSDQQDYIDYINSKGISYPDVTVAADIEDEMSLFKNAPHNFAKLCKTVLQRKPHAQNVFLSRVYPTGNAELKTIQLASSSDEKAIDLDGTPICIGSEPIAERKSVITAMWSLLDNLKGYMGY